MKYSIVLMLNATTKWWVMNTDYRANLFKQHLFPVLTSYADQIECKVFNAEPFNPHVSDFFVLETTNLEQYYSFVKELKSTKLFTNEYFELKEIMMGAENGFKEFNQQMAHKKEITMN